MPGEGEEGRQIRAQIESLRVELAEMRAELRAVGAAVDQMTRTFRSLATQLGIAAEPYRSRSDSSTDPDLRGFG